MTPKYKELGFPLLLQKTFLRHIKPYIYHLDFLIYSNSNSRDTKTFTPEDSTTAKKHTTKNNMSGKDHIQAPQEDDDKINRTLRENLPDNVNEVDLGAKDQKGMLASCLVTSPLSFFCLTFPYPFSLPAATFLRFVPLQQC